MTQELPAPPYPSETLAKGWRFELDHEVMDQSDTWSLAGKNGGEARPWLLMLWLTAWKQKPCGSLPNDEEVIAAAIGMPDRLWAKHRRVMMRNWQEARDGRLYHSTITKRVLAMLDKRANDAERSAARRARKAEAAASPPEVTHASRVTHGGVQGESDTKHQAPSTISQPAVEKTRAKRASVPAPDDVSESVWSDWLDLRKRKRADVTSTVVEAARAEAGKAGLTFEAFLRVWCLRGTQGLQAEWLRPDERRTAQTARQAEVAKWLPSGSQGGEIIDMEVGNGPRRALG